MSFETFDPAELLVSSLFFRGHFLSVPVEGFRKSRPFGLFPGDEYTPDHFRSASFVGENRVVFNIKGNTYRIVVKIKYEKQLVFVRFVGTHTDYDAINVEEV